MPKSDGQKTKILYIRDYLERNSDAEHPVSTQELLEYLAQLGIECERKSIYSDIQALQDYGVDIMTVRGAKGGYYVASRVFELPELKLLMDSVQSARFLTQKKSRELNRKLLQLCNRREGNLIHREVLVTGRTKSMNESIYYNLDAIQNAIAANRQISFRYFDWDCGHRQRFRPGPYQASPYALCLDSENYYLLAHTEKHHVTHYRVDRMLQITQCEQPRTPCPELTGQALADYTNRVFDMFYGERTQVKMRFANHLANAVFDRYGADAMLIPDGPAHFTYTAEVAVSPRFYGWLLGLFPEAQLLYPQSLRQELLRLCLQAAQSLQEE